MLEQAHGGNFFWIVAAFAAPATTTGAERSFDNENALRLLRFSLQRDRSSASALDRIGSDGERQHQ
jgi:hypothetical protein